MYVYIIMIIIMYVCIYNNDNNNNTTNNNKNNDNNIYIHIICKNYSITKVVNANSWNVANYTNFHMPMPSTVCGTALPSIINVYNYKACTLLSSNKNFSNRCLLLVAHWPNHDEGPQRRSFLPEALASWAKGS